MKDHKSYLPISRQNDAMKTKEITLYINIFSPIILFIISIILYILCPKPINYTISIRNYSKNDIVIKGVSIDNTNIYNAIHTLKPSDKNTPWIDGVFYIDIKKYPFYQKELCITYNDTEKDINKCLDIIDQKKGGCLFMIAYREDMQFSSVCDSYTDFD